MIKNRCPFSLIAINLVVFFFVIHCLLAQGNAVIVPGVGVGVLKLGSKVGEIDFLIGGIKASSGEKTIANLGKETIEEMRLSYNAMGMTLVYDYKSGILTKIIVVTHGLLIENTGLGVGSTAEDIGQYVKNTFKQEVTEASKLPELDCPQQGIKFYFKDGLTYAIEVKQKEVPEKAKPSNLMNNR